MKDLESKTSRKSSNNVFISFKYIYIFFEFGNVCVSKQILFYIIIFYFNIFQWMSLLETIRTAQKLLYHFSFIKQKKKIKNDNKQSCIHNLMYRSRRIRATK